MSAVAEPIAAISSRNSSFASVDCDIVASLQAATKRHRNGVLALDGLSLELRCGELVALLGPNGADKSTAVMLMMGLSSPTVGRVRIFGADPRFAGNRIRMGVMLQLGRAPEMLRVREHIEIMRGYYPRPLSLEEIVCTTGLEGIEERIFGQLAGGQKQRALFALAGDADLIFLDEPTVGLGIQARRLIWAQICSLRARGKTVVAAARLEVGASGYLLKDRPASQLAEAIRRVYTGLRAVDPELAAEARGVEADPLNDRERRIPERASDGRSSAEIATEVQLSGGTVRNYLSEAIAKLGAANRVDAVRIARPRG